MVEKILFNMIAFSLFIIIFSKIIRRNDTNYISLLVLEAIGIAICFFEIMLDLHSGIIVKIIRWTLSIVIPGLVIILELRGVNFSEILALFAAKFLCFIGDQKDAKTVLLNLINKYPDSYACHKKLAEIYEKEGGMRRAIEEYVSAIDIKKNDYASYFKIAGLLNELGKKDEAIEMLENLVRNKPDEMNASIMLGDLLCEQGRYKEAINVYTDALQYHPSEYDLYYNLGIAYTMINDFQSAKECYEMAADINHYLYGAHYGLGEIALLEKDLVAAEKYFTICLNDEELEAKAYYELAKIFMFKEEKDRAIEFINKAIELDESLLKIAEQEPIFKNIKQYFTVSVKMKDEEKESSKEKKFSEKELKMQAHMEETNRLIENLSENTFKRKAQERVSLIINKEKMRRLKEQEELEIQEKKNKEEELQKMKE